jgi:transcriptional regulator with XRE-family HTH domain
MESIGDRIKRLREADGKRQEDIALALNSLGIKADRTQVARWESGKTTPLAGAIMALSKIFGVTSDYIIEGISCNNVSIQPNERAIIEAVRLNPHLAQILDCAKGLKPDQIQMACRLVKTLLEESAVS